MALNIDGTSGISGVDGSVSAPALTGTDSNTGITFPAADTIKFSTGGVERMAITNSGVSGITAGITQADQWRVTSSFDSSDTDVTANWERNDTDFALIGSGMTESSGIFTFPATGIYKVEWVTNAFRMPSGATLKTVGGYIYTTTNNSSYNVRASGANSISTDNYANATSYQSLIFDVTDTSTHKVKFAVFSEDTMRWDGQTDRNLVFATFIKLGDT